MIVRTITQALLPCALLLSGCERLTGPVEPRATWSKVPLDEPVTDAYTGFGFEMFRQLRAADPDGNVVLSGPSAAIALTMAYNGAAGATLEEMATALGVGELDREAINQTNRAWIGALADTGDPGADRRDRGRRDPR